MQANQSVRLFHREYECYVSAEGSFAESNQVVVEDGECVIDGEVRFVCLVSLCSSLPQTKDRPRHPEGSVNVGQHLLADREGE